jgi:hypothetical protein
MELVPDDTKYQYRTVLLETFAAYGIKPSSKLKGGIWEPPEGELVYDRTHYEAMQHEPEEVFRFIWENRKVLKLHDDAYTRVLSVRPCIRRAPDGFFVRETVGEYIQMIDVRASELGSFGIKKPSGMPADFKVRLYGGGSLIFDEYGRLKFHIRNRIMNPKRQTDRLRYLWESGTWKDAEDSNPFAMMHRRRSLGLSTTSAKEFDS